MWTKKIVGEWVCPRDLVKNKADSIGQSNQVAVEDDGMEEIEKYPWIMSLMEEYLIEQQEDDSIKMFKLLRYGLKKERNIRGQFQRLLDITKDQNKMTGNDVKEQYLRPWNQRNSFSL